MRKLLEVEKLCVRYGKIAAVNGVSFSLNEGELLAIVGANGAGKTSVLNAIMGLVKVHSGRIVFDGVDITHLEPWKRARMGIVIVPEGARPFADMSVMENLEVAAMNIDKAEMKRKMEWVFELFPRLAERKKQPAKTLSGGEKQMLAIARALVGPVKLLIMDEVSLGLMPRLVTEMFKVIERLKREKLTMLLAEQNTKKALQVADKVCVMQNGSIVLEGKPQDLLDSEEIKRAYLGV
ncbi:MULTISPECIES: ABC transporter ATP-binding protein [Pseudothermotoga]|uniref:ABC transporter ATP-binding protein n=1 Tax=Pseudothermotoga TaxID=1643951 RepID=UPI0009DD1BFF|nr:MULTISPECIES: ABC transporter ATP-binding protein [Pseudothermotoga]MDI6862720.1 ABC transporter ATP-binding protein [Pseudothermotoga sp.]